MSTVYCLAEVLLTPMAQFRVSQVEGRAVV